MQQQISAALIKCAANSITALPSHWYCLPAKELEARGVGDMLPSSIVPRGRVNKFAAGQIISSRPVVVLALIRTSLRDTLMVVEFVPADT
jgi:hypothetical protein